MRTSAALASMRTLIECVHAVALSGWGRAKGVRGNLPPLRRPVLCWPNACPVRACAGPCDPCENRRLHPFSPRARSFITTSLAQGRDVNKSLSMTVYETKWIPSSARFVLLGSPARQTGMLQIYQLNGGSIELEAEVERPKSFKCGTFGATTLAERRIATGDFVGTLAIWDLERLKVRPNLALALALTPALALAPAPAPASGQALALALTLTRRRWSSRRTTRSSTVSTGAVGSRVPCS